ncbi:MAG: AbrB/MazE/SpoVT family DNA-binding domain-containing protein [Nitrospirota bacterium]|nr:AbrB/MazE/SpoVT family DNA-binding domain-containing protein [Nitrospirota bacterium]
MANTVIGTTKVTTGGKITLIADVRRTLGVDEGSVLVFEKNDKNEVIIRKGS